MPVFMNYNIGIQDISYRKTPHSCSILFAFNNMKNWPMQTKSQGFNLPKGLQKENTKLIEK